MLRIWPGHCHFSEDFSNFEQRIKNNQSQPSHGGAEKQRDFKCSWWEIKEIRQEQHSCTTRDQHFLDSYSFIRIWFFCVCNSCATVIPEWLSHHLDTRRFCVDTFLDLGKRLLQCSRVQSRFRGTRTLPYALVSCGTVHFFRGTRTLPYALVSCGTVHFFRGTSIERERILVLCFGHNRERCSSDSEAERENDGIFEGGRRPTKG